MPRLPLAIEHRKPADVYRNLLTGTTEILNELIELLAEQPEPSDLIDWGHCSTMSHLGTSLESVLAYFQANTGARR